MLERDIEKYLVRRVKALGGKVEKVQWVGRKNAPDRVVMLPKRDVPPWKDDAGRPGPGGRPMYWGAGYAIPEKTIWVELKNPETIKTFPANAHERAQAREHQRMRALGQRVEVIGTLEGVDGLLS